jgi:wobble nucleotide-excising tRNase
MLKKIVRIQNVGKYKNFESTNVEWNGELEPVNIIYAHNGAGKTTLSMILKSLKGDEDIVNKKKSFSATEEPEILLIIKDNKQAKFENGVWNKNIKNIEIFDAYYAEDNAYLISLNETSAKTNGDFINNEFYDIILGEDNVKIKNELDLLKIKRRKLSLARRKKKRSIKLSDEIYKEEQIKKHDWITKKGAEVEQRIKYLSDILFINIKKNAADVYLEKINYYVRKFNPAFKITKLAQFNFRLVYSLEVLGHLVRTDDNTYYSLKYTLSEGDKNALAFSFFLARLDILPDLSSKIVVFDDPISSFDNLRRNTTINELYNLSTKVSQLIFLTHELNFAKELTDKFNNKCLNLQIVYKNETSLIEKHDIEADTLNGIFKDLSVLHRFIREGANNDIEKREVLRCIRPVLEGMFRIKFFGHIGKNEWLGDMIRNIRESEEGTPFFRLKSIWSELSDINDYSKGYHHSSPNSFDMQINDEELRIFVQRTLHAITVI